MMLKDYSTVVAALNGNTSKTSQAVKCPAHDDSHESLSIWIDAEGRTAVNCHAGCKHDDVVAAINKITGAPEKQQQIVTRKQKQEKFSIVKLTGNEPELPLQRNEVARYLYKGYGYVVRAQDESGRKQFFPYQYARDNATGELKWVCQGFKGAKQLYLNDRVKPDSKGIIIVEGEKCVDALGKLGVPAATWMGGAQAIKNARWDDLPANPQWYFWPDNDEPGQKAAAWFLENYRKTILLPAPQDKPAGWDVADAIAEGWTADDIVKFVNSKYQEHKKAEREKKEISLLDYVEPMGYNKEGYFYFVKEAKMVFQLSSSEHSKNRYISLAPLSVWESCFNSGEDMAQKDWDKITDLLMRQCYNKGYLTLDKLRGRGTWFDQDRLVVHLGDRLLVDGKEVALGDLKTKHVYEIGDPLPSVVNNSLPKEQSKHLIDVCKHLKWVNPNMGLLLAGFMALTPIAGCLPWRPHVYVTGAKQSGKTTVMNHIISRVLGDWAINIVGGTTEAGIRSRIKFDSLTVVYDEGGIENEKEQSVMDAVIKLARSASSAEGAILKGTSGGGSVEYNIRSMFVFSSVNPNITNDQDQSRIALLSLVPSRKHDPEAEEHYKKLLEMLAVMDKDWCAGLIARSILLTKNTLKNVQVFRTACQKKYGDARKGDQFGTLLAGAYSLVSDDIVTVESALKWVHENSIEEAFFGVDTTDEERCWDRLMQYRVTLSPTNKPPVGELIDFLMTNQNECEWYNASWADTELRRLGIRVDSRKKIIWIAATSTEMRKVFNGTPWLDYIITLRRLPFFDGSEATVQNVCGQKKKCYKFNYAVD